MTFQTISRTGRIVDAGVIRRRVMTEAEEHGTPSLAHATVPLRSHWRRAPGLAVHEGSVSAAAAGCAIALVWANTAEESYFRFAHALSFPVNEVGMALFMALLAQEAVETVMPGGALHTWRRWGLPVVGAAGGFAGAALVYLGLCVHQRRERAVAGLADRVRDRRRRRLLLAEADLSTLCGAAVPARAGARHRCAGADRVRVVAAAES